MHVMFSSLSHELRTPLNSFENVLTLLESNQKLVNKLLENVQLEVRTQTQLQRLETSSDNFIMMGKVSAKLLNNLVEDVLDFAKIEAGTFSLNPSSFNLQDLITEIKYIFSLQCEKKGIKLEFLCERELIKYITESRSRKNQTSVTEFIVELL